MKHTNTNPTTTRALCAFGIAALATLGTATSVAAARPKPPALSVTGGDTWSSADTGDAVVTGPASVILKHHEPTAATLTAVLATDDGTLPGPETCESASATFTVEGQPKVRMTLIGTGTVCGEYPQLPTYVVTHVFTGRYEVVDAGRHRLEGTDGFFEIRLGLGGVASAFAVDT